MVDVHVGVALAALGHHCQKISQRLSFVHPVMRPQRSEAARGPASKTPNRYSSPQSRPSAVHSGSPSKSKNRSPGSGSGNRASGCGSAISNFGTPVSRCRTCSLAWAANLPSVLDARSGTGPVVLGQVGDRGDPGVNQLVPLGLFACQRPAVDRRWPAPVLRTTDNENMPAPPRLPSAPRCPRRSGRRAGAARACAGIGRPGSGRRRDTA